MKRNYLLLILAAALVAVALWNGLPTESSPRIEKKDTGMAPPPPSLQKTEDHQAELNEIHKLEELLKQNPNDADHWTMLGNLYFDIGQFEKALAPYSRALEFHPDNPDIRTDYAVCFFNLGRSEEAITELNRVIKANPKHVTAFFNLGVIHNHLSHTDQARQYWNKVIELDPSSPMATKAGDFLKQM